MLDTDKIKTNLQTRHIGSTILLYDRTASTNDVAAEYAKNKRNHGLVIIAEEQTAGRGRSGAQWLSAHSRSILCSVLLTKCKLTAELLSLTVAVAVAETIGKVGKSEARIKWPNDILLAGKKVAGLLLESKPFANYTAYIIGVGINCHQAKGDFPDELKQTATSIDIESATSCDRISLTKRLLTCLEHWLDLAEKKPAAVIDRWRRQSVLLNHRVSLIYNGDNFTGNCIGVDPQKGLIVQLDSGSVRMFPAAQTSVKK